MAYQVLARKWRPQRFDEVVGQEHIVKSLKQALISGKVAHAYLFAGTRGVGKTSMARIFAKSLRCESPHADGNPCLKCSACAHIEDDNSMDVLEIDGASHNGVDHIRALIENVHYLPVTGRFKVYIIDEVHMLSKEAFNALLKTLEAPPSFVVFIFATTLPEKLLDTVLSRCQRFDFREVTALDLQKHLERIAESEGIHFSTPQMVQALAIEASGSVRDALSLLDQVAVYTVDGVITEEVLHQTLGMVRKEKIWELMNDIYQGHPLAVSSLYRSILSQNANLKRLVLSILDGFYQIVVSGAPSTVLPDYNRVELFWVYETLVKDLQWALESMIPDKVVEVVLQKVAYRKEFFGTPSSSPSPISSPTESRSNAESESELTSGTGAQVVAPPIIPPIIPMIEKTVEVSKVTIEKKWDDFIDFVYQTYPTLAANLEHGNILSPMIYKDDHLKVELAFAASGKIFYDYLLPEEEQQRIKKVIAEFFEISLEEVSLHLTYLTAKEKEVIQFQGHLEKEEKQKENEIKQQKEKILNHELIKSAELLFGSTVQQINIKL